MSSYKNNIILKSFNLSVPKEAIKLNQLVRLNFNELPFWSNPERLSSSSNYIYNSHVFYVEGSKITFIDLFYKLDLNKNIEKNIKDLKRKIKKLFGIEKEIPILSYDESHNDLYNKYYKIVSMNFPESIWFLDQFGYGEFLIKNQNELYFGFPHQTQKFVLTKRLKKSYTTTTQIVLELKHDKILTVDEGIIVSVLNDT